MKAALLAAAATLILADVAAARTSSQTVTQPAPRATPRPGSDLTRDLNSAPGDALGSTPPGPATAAPVEPEDEETDEAPPPRPTPAPPPAPAPRAVVTPPAPAPRQAPPVTTPPVTTPAPATVDVPSAASRDLTRSLNGGPAVPATPPAAAPATPPPAAAPTRPVTATPLPAPVSPAPSTPVAASPPPVSTPPAARPATPPPAATPSTEAPPAPPPASILRVTTPPPFDIDLPSGVTLVQRPAGPGALIYEARKGDAGLVAVYVGCCSQFPIYEGRQVQVQGRYSVVAVEAGEQHAMEHLFQRDTEPREIHVWVQSVADADRAQAEAIAQSVNPK